LCGAWNECVRHFKHAPHPTHCSKTHAQPSDCPAVLILALGPSPRKTRIFANNASHDINGIISSQEFVVRMRKKEQPRMVVDMRRKNKNEMMMHHFWLIWWCSEQSARHFLFKHRVTNVSEKLTRDEAIPGFYRLFSQTRMHLQRSRNPISCFITDVVRCKEPTRSTSRPNNKR